MNNIANSNDKLTVGDYVLINNKYIGYIVKTIWNSNGYIVKLEDNEDYLDKTLSQYKLLNNNNIYGYMLLTLNDLVKKINFEQIQDLLIKYDTNEINNIIRKINIKYENFLRKISKFKTSDLILEQDLNILSNDLYNINKFPIYNYQAVQDQEEDYIFYITKMIIELFAVNKKSIWEEDFYIGESKSNELFEDSDVIDIIKKALFEVLENYDEIKTPNELNFKNTLMYKHLILDNQLDMLSLGKEFIKIIKMELLKIQEDIKFDDDSILLESTNIFDFLNFKIVGEYIEITSNLNEDNFRIITQELVPNLKNLSSQYSKPIDYDYLSTIILQNKTYNDVITNKEIIEEALKILSQEYIICFQPKMEVLLWTISRIIISWYADSKLWDNIFKIKILINLFRARGIKEFNKDQGVQPVIIIIPKYGKKIATKVLSHLSYLFFPYKKLGWDVSNPTWFNKLDNLMYYTNGSLELKKYTKLLLSTQTKFNNPLIINMSQINNPLTKDMTRINLPNQDNKIEYQI